LRIHPGLTNSWPEHFQSRTLTGAKYIPLRKSIGGNYSKESGYHLELLVVGGGSDVNGFVPSVVNELQRLTSDFHATIFTNYSILPSLDGRFTQSEVGSNLDMIANSADLVFTTASTTSLEFLARGAAVAIGCAVDNQKLYYKELSSGNFAAPIGEFLDNRWNFDYKLIRDLVDSEISRESLKSCSANLIDLKGAKRIVDEILKF
jgi:spore coat polysaccharide biosynthesis predicted glycosyltransferase SpsG